MANYLEKMLTGFVVETYRCFIFEACQRDYDTVIREDPEMAKGGAVIFDVKESTFKIVTPKGSITLKIDVTIADMENFDCTCGNCNTKESK